MKLEYFFPILRMQNAKKCQIKRLKRHIKIMKKCCNLPPFSGKLSYFRNFDGVKYLTNIMSVKSLNIYKYMTSIVQMEIEKSHMSIFKAGFNPNT